MKIISRLRKWMRAKVLLVIILITLGGWGEDYYRCYSYEKGMLQLHPYDASVFRGRYDRFYLAVPENFDELHPPYLMATAENGARIVALQALLCRPAARKGFYECGGECDGGQLDLDGSFALHHRSKNPIQLSLWNLEALEEEIRVLLQPTAGHSVTPAKPSPCPPVVATLYHPDRDGKDGEVEHRYVCYDSKASDGTYRGCIMSPVSCRQLGKQHFGRYPGSWATKEALVRCLVSKPRPGR
jgi:hypothetical protein